MRDVETVIERITACRRMEASADLRNLLAQGYVPVMGRDGRTVYLVQSARSVRGGIAFNF